MGDFDKIFEILKVDALDESSKELVAKYITDVVDLKAKEKSLSISESVIAEEKERLSEEYEMKFNDYKEDIFSKWSDFTDKVIAEEVKIPSHVLEWAKVGEQYAPLLEAIRTQLAISEGSVDEEAKALLSEAKDEIISLREKLNKLMSENVTLQEDAKSMAVHIYLRKKCDGLTEAQRTKVMSLLEDESDVQKINEKFELVLEHILNEKKSHKEPDGDECDLEDDDKKDKKKKDKKKKDDDDDDKKNGKGKEEVVEESTEWNKLLENLKVTVDNFSF